MNPVATQQVTLDNSLVAPKKRLKIEKCNARIAFSKPQREETYQVTLDALKLTPCYPAFLVTTEVPEVYMHQFWNTIQKVKDTNAYRIKLDKKKNSELMRKSFVKFSRYVPEFSTKTLLHHLQKKNWLHSFRNLVILASVICYLHFILIKCTSLGEHLLQSSIDFMYQADNREISSARKEHMPYLRFTKVPPKKARKYNKVTLPSRKLSPVLEEEPAEMPKKAKKPAKKSTTVTTVH
ncbi:hypothetical protein Tco_1333267 [Tanacetum coccineum]